MTERITTMPTLTIAETPLSSRPCIGLGVQADCFIYDEVNRQFGVNDDDYARWERRLKALRPGIARIFLPLTEFNPSGDGHTYDWETAEMRRQYRNLTVLKDAGARVNLCMGPWTNTQMTAKGSERWAVDLVEHLVREQGYDHIRWLTLFNEPDAFYAPDTPLNQELQARGFGGGLPFADYVAKHRRALPLLAARGLAGQVRLVVGDIAWPPRRRQEWLELLGREFAGTPAAFAFHHYAPDDDSYFDHPDAKPFQPPPLAEEMRGYRAAVGPEAELVCWEFNQLGWSVGSAAWMGCGSRGEDHMGTFETAVAHTRKALTMLAHGVDGLSHWCVGDMFYRSGLPQGVMYCGLWRYKWESWVPRPVYFYYAALVEAFRPGSCLHALEGLPEHVVGLAARRHDQQVVAILNHGPVPVSLSVPVPGAVARLRIAPDRLPRRPDILQHERPATDEPLRDWETLAPAGPEQAIELQPAELTLLRATGAPTTKGSL